MLVRTGLSPSLFLCVHDLPDNGWPGQLKHVVVLNTTNIQDLYSCVCRKIKVNIWLINVQLDDVT